MRCPACRPTKRGEAPPEMLGPRPARLDQSGDTYLNAEAWVCPSCDLIITRPTSFEWARDEERCSYGKV